MVDPGAACPICARPADEAQRPFCSRRCADVDLGRWLTGQYRVPGPPAEPPETAQDDRARTAGATGP